MVFNMPRTKTQAVTKNLLRLMCFLKPNHLPTALKFLELA
ncbi:hypothetical protein HPHPH28_1012 [Helicobacter pylori Hp H-28]|nr:hypothetical protein HPHPH28_1012 [Helicobacter pylori Hp H-28]